MNDIIVEDAEKTMIGVPDSAEATQMVMAPQGESTQYAANVECPVCHTPNPLSETYCMDCGFLLNSQPIAIGDMPEIKPAGKLVMADGTREFVLRPGQNTVGRENADVLLSHNTVSRRHAVVIVEVAGVFVEDAGSTNGTTVDGRKIGPGDKVQLKNGSELVFGNAAVRAELPEAAVEEQPEAETEVTQLVETAEPGGEADVTEQAEATGAAGELAEEPAEAEAEEPAAEEAAPAGTLVSKDGGVRLSIRNGTNSIGRREGNDIVVPDPYCSGSHAQMIAEDGAFTLADLGSTNGTFVNGVQLDANSPKELQIGDEITFGQMVFTIEVA